MTESNKRLKTKRIIENAMVQLSELPVAVVNNDKIVNSQTSLTTSAFIPNKAETSAKINLVSWSVSKVFKPIISPKCNL